MFISEQTGFHRFIHRVKDMIFFCINKFTFTHTCVQIQFKVPSREIGRLLSNCLSNKMLKLEMQSNVKARLKKCVVLF